MKMVDDLARFAGSVARAHRVAVLALGLTVGASLPAHALSLNVPRLGDVVALVAIPPSTHMPNGVATTVAPPGFVSFCMRRPDQCRDEGFASASIRLTPDRWKTLLKINREVNSAIRPKSDFDHYGRREYWTIPSDGYGDCEDSALTKREYLLDAGFPSGALRLAIALTEHRARHTVLTITTDRGDYVLDNRNNDIRAWSDMHYVWLMRQSVPDPERWVSFVGKHTPTTPTSSR